MFEISWSEPAGKNTFLLRRHR